MFQISSDLIKKLVVNCRQTKRQRQAGLCHTARSAEYVLSSVVDSSAVITKASKFIEIFHLIYGYPPVVELQSCPGTVKKYCQTIVG